MNKISCLFSHSGSRFIELDLLRGVAIIMMAIFHLRFDLSFFGIIEYNLSQPMIVFGHLTATMFITIAGISASIKLARCKPSERYHVFLKSGIKLLLLGALITIVTFFFLNGEGYVVYGILSLIGTGLILSPIIIKNPIFSLITAVFIILFSFIDLPSGPLWLSPLGIHEETFTSVDYTPIIPWLSFFFIGSFIGHYLYPNGKSKHSISANNVIAKLLAAFGRHSLFIYLIHQPLIILILLVIFI